MNQLELTVLTAVLDHQTGEGVLGDISEERIYAALTTGPEFSIEERRLLWLSPDVRETYFGVRESLDREMRDHLFLSGYGREQQLRSASSDKILTINGPGYALTVFHDQIGGQEEWSLSLHLTDDFRAKLFARTVVRLYDSGGLTWLKGVPDEIGQIGSLWEHRPETPAARASKYGLFVGI